MSKNIDKIKNFRLHLLKEISELTTQQLNDIPEGFNNSIIWNVAHLISAQQNMCYARAALPIIVPEKYIAPFAPGTKPMRFVDHDEIKLIKDIFITSIEKFHADFANDMFGNYTPSVMIPKVYGFEVNNIGDAIDYLLYHEGFHSGYVISMKHCF